jgi:hypothetical protein
VRRVGWEGIFYVGILNFIVISSESVLPIHRHVKLFKKFNLACRTGNVGYRLIEIKIPFADKRFEVFGIFTHPRARSLFVRKGNEISSRLFAVYVKGF